MNDLTIVFYTANIVNERILNIAVESLKNHQIPIISVSQKEMDFGKNIVVPRAYSVRNLYTQVLIGAKEATTEYVALCEDDCIYVSEHFRYRPKHFGYNLNRWNLHLREEVFSYRGRPVLSQCIAHRKSLIDTLTERLALEELPDNLNGEPGRLEKKLGITEYSLETYRTEQPNLVICHSNGICGHKKIGTDVTKNIKGLGSVDGWLNMIYG